MSPISLDHLRRFAVTRSLFEPTTLPRALERLGFVQADPIRAPARAQDLTLRHRVKGYRAGDLERRYTALGVEEDFFINYGFVTRSVHALMHPRGGTSPLSPKRRKQAQALLEFVRERGHVHPREADDHFDHGTVTNYWGGSSSLTTRLLDDMHYRGLLRIARRERGIRIYALHRRTDVPIAAARRREHVDALIDLVCRIYGPLPRPSLVRVVSRLRYAVPQWADEVKAGLRRATGRLAHTAVDGTDWYWPADEGVGGDDAPEAVRLLSPFDPVVWDRDRFERLWGWAYRFEAYTPVAKRVRGYYSLPMLWRERVIGWANLSVKNRELHADVGYVAARPRERAFTRELEAELARIRVFLDLPGSAEPGETREPNRQRHRRGDRTAAVDRR